MDDLSKLLSGISSDPEALGKLKGIASELLSGSGEKSDAASKNDEENGPDFSSADIQKIVGLVSAMGSKDDSRSALLMSLKPHLSPKRCERVDSAVKILRLIKLMPLLKTEL